MGNQTQVDGPPPQPALRAGFVVVSPWQAVRGSVPPFAIGLPELDPHSGWIMWIGKSGANPLPIHAGSNASQGDVDRLAFNVCRKIDQALGLPVKK